jgi:hypothetical protein
VAEVAKLTKTMAETRLGDVAAEKYFFCQDGQVFRNLRELEAALSDMSLGTYQHHVDESKNDFSNWVGQVIGDDKLSRDLLKSVGPVQAGKSVAARIAWLESKLN